MAGHSPASARTPADTPRHSLSQSHAIAIIVGIALFVLRVRDPGTVRPFKVPLYPVLPLIFIISSTYMLWSSLSYVSSQAVGSFNAAWIGIAVLLSGGLVLAFLSMRQNALKSPA